MTRQKEAIRSWMKLVSQGKIREAYEEFIAFDFIHHNQYLKGDRQSLLEGMESSQKAHPIASLEIHHLFEDGDYVTAHSRIKQAPDREIVVVHIFKFRGGQIVELWDVGQMLDKDSPNRNGAF